MAPEPTRPLPTAADIEKLARAFRDNPRSTGFVPLADAYLALGRAREAIEILQRGLLNHPDHAEGRLLLGRAHAALHQWKEAQAELLKVVRADRASREGFRLLGEVLLRRADYERALAMLQHAINLDPADAKVLAMLKRAREGRPLDPPPPIPTPLAPAGASVPPVPEPAAAGESGRVRAAPPIGSGPVRRSVGFDSQPTKVADEGVIAAALREDETSPGATPRPSDGETNPGVDDGPQEEPTIVQDPLARRTKPPPAPPAARSGPPVPAARPAAAPPPPPPRRPSTPPPLAREDETERDLETTSAKATAPLGRMALERQGVRAAEERVSRKVQDERIAEPAPAKKPAFVPPAEDPFRPLTDRSGPVDPALLEMGGADPAEIPSPPTPAAVAPPAPPPPARPVERPRLEAAPHKERDAGGQAMRVSAAVGEDYLNELLGGGLLAVPNVDARDAEAIPQGKRWGRSTKRTFILLCVFTAFVMGGGVAWYRYTKQQRDSFVAERLKTAEAKLAVGRSVDLAEAARELERAIERDPGNVRAVALLAETRALDLYVFGAGEIAQVDAPINWLGPKLRDAKPDAPGRRELAVARVARNLAMLDKMQEPQTAIAEARAELAAALAVAPQDGLLLWLDGALKLTLGDRAGARAAFEKADAAPGAPPLARISLADLQLDDGDAQAAAASYDAALARADQHPMAVVGRALARLERSAETDAAMQDLNVNLAGVRGGRIESWKQLALAAMWAHLEDYEKAQKELDVAAASPLSEARYLARVALARLDRGKIVEAGRTRSRIKVWGDAPARDPLMALLDGELYLASGMPEEALAAVADLQTVRARIIRARALIDAGKPADAIRELDAVLEIAAADPRARAYRELARVLAKTDAKTAREALQKMARASMSGLPAYVLAEAELALGETDDALRKLEESVKGENPLAYRARTRLGELYAAAGRADDAEKVLREALEQSPLYVPAHAALGRLLFKAGKHDEARAELEAVVAGGRASAADELAYAEALVLGGKKEDAKEPLRRAKEKGAPPEEVARVAALIDPAFATELGLEAPPPEPAPQAPPKRRRGRR